jgi:hypothetical protein
VETENFGSELAQIISGDFMTATGINYAMGRLYTAHTRPSPPPTPPSPSSKLADPPTSISATAAPPTDSRSSSADANQHTSSDTTRAAQ